MQKYNLAREKKALHTIASEHAISKRDALIHGPQLVNTASRAAAVEALEQGYNSGEALSAANLIREDVQEFLNYHHKFKVENNGGPITPEQISHILGA